MKLIQKLTLAFSVFIGSTLAVHAEEFVKGKVKKVDAEKGRVTVIHEEIPNLEMPAMTMVFQAGDDTKVEELKPDQDIEFVAERIKGKLTITKIKE